MTIDTQQNKLNVFEKLNAARAELLSLSVRKTGANEYTDFKYMKLEDFLGDVIRLENKYKFMTIVSYDDDVATMTIVNTEMPPDRFKITSPMSTAKLKAAHEVQNLGAVLTYERRYLYLTAYNIIEEDVLDSTIGHDDRERRPTKAAPSQAKVTSADVLKTLKANGPKIDSEADRQLPLETEYTAQLQKYALHRHSKDDAAKAYQEGILSVGKTGTAGLTRSDYVDVLDAIDNWMEE